MSKQTICEKERRNLKKMNKFQLKHKYKKLGLYITIVSFVAMILLLFLDESIWIKPVFQGVILIGLLVMSLSKEKIEDEYVDSLRSQSYRVAFISVVLYSVIQPIAIFIVGFIFKQGKVFESFNYFQVLYFMLLVQLLIFWVLKRADK
ncbi:hypothetical protein SHK09_10940 [Polaribacter sp. PL03]|uniref:hypothetical protein n=1 Tax=Polaribacter sp. PL03 TaxID=3088353 RepID=UPI0029CCF065|nr:hypothetical protein [Polaribacter sp. PL03]MDX6747309.1 hypothetical protein [Polaribacter sp. PL03]